MAQLHRPLHRYGLPALSLGLERASAAIAAASRTFVFAAVCWTLALLLVDSLALWLLASLSSYLTRQPLVQAAVVAGTGDAVYGRLILALTGNVEARGLAGWGSVLFSSGSSAVAVQLARMAVDLGMLAVGAFVLTLRFRRPRANGRAWPLLAAWLAVAIGLGSTLRLSWTGGSGGDMMLSMVTTKVLGRAGQAQAGASSPWFLSLVLDLALATLAALAGAGLGLLASKVHRRRSAPDPQGQPAVATAPAWPRFYAQRLRWNGGRSDAGLGRAQLAAVPPREGLALLRTRSSARARPSMALEAATLLALLGASVRPAVAFEHRGTGAGAYRLSALAAAPAPGALPNLPSVVTISRNGDAWQYQVNGHVETIKGMGYNAVTVGLPPEERAARLDRDFASISAAGVNTIAGWTENEFDDLLMRKAADHGLGVILPFHLGPTYVLSEPDYAYEDPRVQQQLLAAISARVVHFRNSPALRMWGLGNEVLHALAWAHDSPARAQAFADFLLVAADRVHQLDPNHPVVYRDAEDWYLGPIMQALARNPKPRPWFVYGMNFFTTRLQSALDTGPAATLNQPLFISEFGPVGLRPDARPDGYRQLWDIILSHKRSVLGGSAYVWTIAGPEPLDRNFGLTDASGQPVDGALAELAALYQGG